MPTAFKAIVGLLMLTAPASLGIAAYSDDVTIPLLETSAPASDAERIETFEGEFDEPVETGRLDLRVDHGRVRVVGWEKNAYKIEVFQTETDDDRTDVSFTDASQGSHLELNVTVDRHRPHGVAANVAGTQVGQARVDKVIVAHVPASATYERVHACQGEEHGSSQAIDDAFERLPGVATSDHEVCVPAGDEAETQGVIQINGGHSPSIDVAWGVIGLDVQTLEIEADDGAIDLERLTLGTATVANDEGDVTAASVDADTLELASDDGNVHFAGTAQHARLVTDEGDVSVEGTISTAEIATDDGSITLVGDVDEATLATDEGDVHVEDVEAKTLTLATDDGDVSLFGNAEEASLSTDEGNVYVEGDVSTASLTSDDGSLTVVGSLGDAKLSTDEGDVVLTLDPTSSGAIHATSDDGNVDVTVPEGDAYGYDVTAATDDGDIVVGLEEARRTDDGNESRDGVEHYRTSGYDERDIQIAMDLSTDEGDVWVTNPSRDGSSASEASDDEGGEDSAGSQPGTALASLVSEPGTGRP